MSNLSIVEHKFLNFIFDYTAKLVRLYFNNSLSSKLILNRETRKRKKSYSSNSKINASKYSSRNKVIEITHNFDNEKSNNSLIPMSYNNNRLNLINPHRTNYLNLNYIPKITKFHEGAAYKNEFYSLKILKNISNKSISKDNQNMGKE